MIHKEDIRNTTWETDIHRHMYRTMWTPLETYRQTHIVQYQFTTWDRHTHSTLWVTFKRNTYMHSNMWTLFERDRHWIAWSKLIFIHLFEIKDSFWSHCCLEWCIQLHTVLSERGQETLTSTRRKLFPCLKLTVGQNTQECYITFTSNTTLLYQ